MIRPVIGSEQEIKDLQMSIETYLSFMLNEVVDASKQSLPYFRGDFKIAEKSNTVYAYDPVTEADKAVEQYLRKQIETRFPDHGIEGEEYGLTNSSSPWRWIIDPIDGTRYFMTGLTGWATLVGLLYEGEPILGMAVQPFTEEVYYGDGTTAFWHHKKVKRQINIPAKASPTLDNCIVMTYSPDAFLEHEARAFAQLSARTKATLYGSDCFAFIMAAMGYIDIVVEANLERYDIVPLLPIIKGAGALATQWNGESATQAGNIIVTPYETILNEAQTCLKL